MIVLCDIDNVVADMMPEWLRLYNNDYSDTLTVDQITDWDLSKFVHPDCGKKIFSYLLYESLYDNVKPIDGALEGLRYIESLGHRVVFVSSGVYSHPKYLWMERHGFDVGKDGRNYVVAHDKSLISGNIMIDDGIHNLFTFSGETTILFDRPWNRKRYDWIDLRARNWAHIRSIFQEIK